MPRKPGNRVAKPPAFEPPRYIAVEGPIRVGKSTLARFLADRMHARRIIDCEDNPFLARFLPRKAGLGFSHADVFPDRAAPAAARGALDAEAPGAVVADFLFEKDKIFAYLNLDNEELKLYERYFERFAAEISAARTGDLSAGDARGAARADRQEGRARANRAFRANTSKRSRAPTSIFSSAIRRPTCWW